MGHDFEVAIERRGTDSKKWSRYPTDVLPLWVADSDFAVAPAITAALAERIAHPVFGYATPTDALRKQLVASLAANYGWQIAPDDLLFLPGVEPGINMTLRAMLSPGDGVVVQTPMYQPILEAPGHWGLRRIDVPLQDGIAGLRPALGQAKALLFCNPHNPIGKVFDRTELTDIAAACEAADTLVISDEIHCDLLFDGRRHVPLASLGGAIAQRTVTLMSASKAYNVAGLKTAFAIIANPALRASVAGAKLGMVDSVNALGLAATQAAYAEGEEWLRGQIAYLQDNRDWLLQAVRTRLPGVAMHAPEGTYLAWLDCSKLRLNRDPQRFFLDVARVGLSSGDEFGPLGRCCVRLNFGCTRATLEEAVRRMAQAIASLT